MLFKIQRSYRSLLTVEQLKQVLEYLSVKESGVWLLKGKLYDVKVDGDSFSVKKRGGSMNGAIHPLVKGQIMQKEFVQVDLNIKPAYYLMIFGSIVSSIAIVSIFSDEKMTVNGVYRSVTLLERLGLALFVIAVPGVVSYFKTIKPVQDAEKWLIRKMQLRPLN